MTPLGRLSAGDDVVVLREAAAADLPALVGLLADDGLGALRDTVEDPLPDAYRVAFDAIDADPNHTLVAGELEGRVVATMQLSVLPGLARRGTRRMQIEAVRVEASLRGRGIGAAMIAWAVAEAQRRDCTLVQLTSDKRRADAHRFYDRLGFVASHEGFKLRIGPDGSPPPS